MEAERPRTRSTEPEKRKREKKKVLVSIETPRESKARDFIHAGRLSMELQRAQSFNERKTHGGPARV